MQVVQHSVEAAVISVSQKATLVGGATAAATGAADKAGYLAMVAPTGDLNVSGFCALGGLVLGIIGLIASIWFQLRRDRRETIEHLRAQEERI